MIPFSGLSIIIHFIIILIRKASEKYNFSFAFNLIKRQLFSYLIIFFIVGLVTTNAFFLIKSSVRNSPNVQLVRALFSNQRAIADSFFDNKYPISAQGAESANLITNPSFEVKSGGLPQLWKTGGFGKNKAVFTYPVAGYNSPKAAKVELTQRSGGDAKWYFQPIPVVAGQKYSFSNNYLSSVTTYVVVQFQLADGKFSYLEIAKLVPVPTTWQQVQKTFVVPANAKYLTIFHLINKVGWLVVDNYKLSTSDTIFPNVSLTNPTAGQILSGTASLSAEASDNVSVAGVQFIIDGVDVDVEVTAVPYTINFDTTVLSNDSHTVSARAHDAAGNKTISAAVSVTVANNIPVPDGNLINNPSLEIIDISDSYPVGWHTGNWGTNQAKFAYPVAGWDGAKAAQVNITQYSNGDVKWYFGDVPVTPNKIYKFTDYYTAIAPSTLTIRFLLANNSFQYMDVADLATSPTWQNVKLIFTAPAGAVSATVFHLLKSVGSLTVDDFYLGESTNAFSPGMVSLNFDDGWLSAYNNGIPILNQAGLKSTQYIFTSGLGDPINNVNAEQVLAMQATGHEIGAHSRTHSHLTQLSPSELQSEVAGSKEDLLAAGVNRVASFAYPFGEYNDAVIDAVKNAGYTGARGTDSGFNTKDINPYLLQGKSVEVTTAFETIKSWIDTATQNKSWLILTFHEVSYNGRQYSTTPETLQRIVDYLVQQNVQVVTNAEGIQILTQP